MTTINHFFSGLHHEHETNKKDLSHFFVTEMLEIFPTKCLKMDDATC